MHGLPIHTPSLAIDCGLLPRPANGQIFLRGTTFGREVTYSCNVDFELVGVALQTCQANGEWSDAPPICKSRYYCGDHVMSCDILYVYVILGEEGRDCGDPGVPSNGRRIGEDFSAGATVTYECNQGFSLVGFNSRTCRGTDGKWSGFLPTCEAGEHAENGGLVSNKGEGYIFGMGMGLE